MKGPSDFNLGHYLILHSNGQPLKEFTRLYHFLLCCYVSKLLIVGLMCLLVMNLVTHSHDDLWDWDFGDASYAQNHTVSLDVISYLFKQEVARSSNFSNPHSIARICCSISYCQVLY